MSQAGCQHSMWGVRCMPRSMPADAPQRGCYRLGLDIPLFQRLLEGGGMSSHLLEVQYRMHPAIAVFPSQQFYNGRVRSGVTGQDRPPVKVRRLLPARRRYSQLASFRQIPAFWL